MFSIPFYKYSTDKTRNLTLEVICFLFILLFFYTGLSKLFSIRTFIFQLGRSPFVTHISGFVAWFLPPAELMIAVMLSISKTRLAGLYISLYTMLLFTGYIYAMLHYSYYVPCSCGGVLSMMSWNQHLIFNIFFSLLALTGILLQSRKISHGS